MAADSTVTPDDIALFEALMKQATPQRIYEALSPDQFEHFLMHVFLCAGIYPELVSHMRSPHGPGVDLNLYPNASMRRIFARVEARRYDPSGRGITLDDVRRFGGTLHFAENIPGYLITTADFAPNAREALPEHSRSLVRLISGDDLVRYVTYVHGSRIRNGQGQYRAPTPILPDWLFSDVSATPPPTARILTVANNKGGVGKTTTALNFALDLASRGHNVLAIDLDGQANLSSALPLPDPRSHPPRNSIPPARASTISRYFSGEIKDLQAVIQPTRFERVFILPGDEELNRLDTGSAPRPMEELAFVQDLRSQALALGKPYDWIVIDTPPAQSYFSRLALAAADVVVIPVRADTFSLDGVNRALIVAKTMAALVSRDQQRAILVTHWKASASTKNIKAKLDQDAAVGALPLLKTVIPYEDRIEQAHIALHGGGTRSVFGWGTSKAAQEYHHALDELLRKVNSHELTHH